MKRANIFGYPVHLTTMEEAVNYAVTLLQDEQGGHVVTINPEIIAAADKNPELAGIIKKAELVIPESTGVILAIRSLGIFDAEKIPGIEFSEQLLKVCKEKGFKVGFLGGAPDVIENLNFSGMNVVFARHGYFKEEETGDIAASIKAAEPQLLLIGLGCPKQEFFITQHRNTLNKTVMIGVGGSFDVWAKKVKRAPIFLELLG